VKRDEQNEIISRMCVHVDDLLVTDRDPQWQEQLVEGLTKAYGKVKLQVGEKLMYLGINIERKGNRYYLHQRNLIEQLDYPDASKPATHPMATDFLDRKDNTPAKHPEHFRSTLMRLLYVSTKTRFDLMFAVSVLCSRQQTCSVSDETALAQLVSYTKRTMDFCHVIAPSDMTLSASADASYSCHEDGYGHSGIVCRLGGSTIFARSSKQRLIAKSSTEAELLALNTAVDEVLYLRNLLEEYGYPPKRPTRIWQDNKSAIIMAERGELGTKRTKHFNVRHFFVTGTIKQGHVTLEHKPGKQIDADALTKAFLPMEAAVRGRGLLDTEFPTVVTWADAREGVSGKPRLPPYEDDCLRESPTRGSCTRHTPTQSWIACGRICPMST
jgi:hypothetical protein